MRSVSARSLLDAVDLLGDHPTFVVEWKTRLIVACNKAVTRVFGYTSSELVGTSTEPLHFDHQSFVRFASRGDPYLEDKGNYRCLIRMRRKSGEVFPAEVVVQLIRDEQSNPVAGLSVIRDLSGSPEIGKNYDVFLPGDIASFPRNLQGAFFQRVVSPDGESHHHYIGGDLFSEDGLSSSILREEPHRLFSYLSPDDRARLEDAMNEAGAARSPVEMVVKASTPDDRNRWIKLFSNPTVMDDGSVVWNSLAIDITATRAAEEREHHAATRDPLTNLYNRMEFFNALDRQIGSADTDDGFAVFEIELRDMTEINNSFGHAGGDEVLKRVAQSLTSTLPATSVVCRAYADRFHALIPHVDSEVELSELLGRLLFGNRTSFTLSSGQRIDVQLSVGVSRFPADGRSADSLMQASGVALKRAMKSADTNYAFYSIALYDSITRDFRLKSALKSALRTRSVFPHFQPQVALRGGELVGFEALARWEAQPGEFVSPAEFIPAAEQIGLIGELDDLILSHVCGQISHWLSEGLGVPTVYVNYSAQDFLKNGVQAKIDGIITSFNIPPHSIGVEITESALIQNFDATSRTMSSLTGQGIRFAIDDFGTGYSSLNYLGVLPFDLLKIDKSFIWEIVENRRKNAIVASLISLASALGMKTLAEGIETIEQRDELIRMGCDYGQGYLFSRPVAHDEAAEWMLRPVS